MQRSITANEFNTLVSSGKKVELIDVRTPVEFREVHVSAAINVPLDRLDPVGIQAARNGTANEPLYVICRSGARGKQACEKFYAAGISNAINVEGGTMACVDAGLPVVRGKKSIPLNCQVQMITGTMVVLGSILSVVLHPFWIGIPLFMGSGLIFAGATNTCAMASILARMPWNQVRPAAASASAGAAASQANTCTDSGASCCK